MSNELASSQRPVSPPPPSAAACKRKAGRKKFRETRHPVYRGVRSRNGGKWVCEVREPVHKTRIWLGTYQTPELAARAHDVAALALKGDEEAQLNFRDSAWLVPRAESCSASDIRAAALKVVPTTSSSSLGSCPSSSAPEKAPESREGDVGMVMAETETTTGFWDEEAVFNMPALMDRMAEAMLLTPPAYKQPNYFSCDEDHDFNLWGY